MAQDYQKLAEKLESVARPRVRVYGTSDGLTVSLLARDLVGDPIAAYLFHCKSPAQDPLNEDLVSGLSNFMELAAFKLDEKRNDTHAVAFAQNLYIEGFWGALGSAATSVTCELAHLDHSPEHWK